MKMQERAIVTHLAITKSGQVRIFQVRLPKNTIRVIGIETSVRIMRVAKTGYLAAGPPAPTTAPLLRAAAQVSAQAPVSNLAYGEFGSTMFFRRDTFFGDLKLQSCEQGNIFFATEVAENVNLPMGDFSQNGRWQALPYNHQSKREEDRVVVDGCTTIIQGIYKDALVQAQQRAQVALIPVPKPVDVVPKTNPNYIVSLYIWVEVQEQENRKGAENDSCTCP